MMLVWRRFTRPVIEPENAECEAATLPLCHSRLLELLYNAEAFDVTIRLGVMKIIQNIMNVKRVYRCYKLLICIIGDLYKQYVLNSLKVDIS